MYKSLNQHKISKRTGKNTVAIVGFSKDTRHLAPFEDEDTEIWSLNEAGIQKWMKRWDRWFQIHPPTSFTRENNPNDPHHFEWLKSQTKPIYMQEKYDYIPASVKYPLGEVTKKYGNYLTSSLAFMLTLAMLEGFERIELYGFRMSTKSEYHYQRANGEYLIGLARGLGHEVWMPPETPLCRGKMYGYESLDVAFRQRLEYRYDNLEEKHHAAEMDAVRMSGRIMQLDEICKMFPDNQELRDMYTQLSSEVMQAAAQANFMKGHVEDTKIIIDMYDQHLEEIGAQDYVETAEESHRST